MQFLDGYLMRNISATFVLARRKIKIPSTFHSQDNLKIFGIPHPYSCKIKADPVQSTSPDPGILLKINRNNMRKYFFSIYFCSSLFFHHTPNAFFCKNPFCFEALFLRIAMQTFSTAEKSPVKRLFPHRK